MKMKVSNKKKTKFLKWGKKTVKVSDYLKKKFIRDWWAWSYVRVFRSFSWLIFPFTYTCVCCIVIVFFSPDQNNRILGFWSKWLCHRTQVDSWYRFSEFICDIMIYNVIVLFWRHIDIKCEQTIYAWLNEK